MDYSHWKHFSLAEFTRSGTADRFEICNEPDALALDNLNVLVTSVLMPLREVLNTPIIITSGFRSHTLNTRVGGAYDSDHLFGCASDLVAVRCPPVDIFAALLDLDLPCIEQVILEYGQWVHVAVDTKTVYGDPPRNEYLIAAKDLDGITRFRRPHEKEMPL